MPITDNSDAYLRAQAAELGPGPGVRTHTLEPYNTAPHAADVEAREGYYVFNDDQIAQAVDHELHQTNRRKRGLRADQMRGALRRAGDTIVEFHASETGTAPPIEEGGAPRPAHPGGFGDVTGELGDSYGFTVDGGAPGGGPGSTAPDAGDGAASTPPSA